MPGLEEARLAELDVDFTDSKLGEEQRVLMADLLGADQTAPYRVSLAERDVIEAEIQQYMELDLIRPSTSPWASPVLMIRKPDGCTAAPAFERLTENVLVDLKRRTCHVYWDDCVVFSSDFPTHLMRLKQVLERFRAAGFKPNMKKCRWGRDQVAFLGHIVTPSGILPNPEKVKAVISVARPHDLHTVRAFLGLTSYFIRYIPIEKLKMKGVEFAWNEDCEATFLQLKRRLVGPPKLAYPDPAKRFKLFVDSSRLALGACLMQSVDGRRVIAYASKLLVSWRPRGGVTLCPTGSQSGREEPKTKKPRTGDGDDVVEPATEGDASVLVGEPPAPSEDQRAADEPDFDDSPAAGDDDAVEDDILEDDDVERVVTPPVDLFGLDRERFIAEQKRSPWIQAVIAFLEHGALALNGQLRVKVLQMAHHYVVRDGMLQRRGHLMARAGPTRSITVPVIPLPFVETVLHYCHSDVFAAHVGQTRASDKVRKHAYWHG
ncbi:hypothetical protein PR003_g11756 [Phytophthora rubi]|uniref:Reverse transcriptase domain-containing protein n=1 Tax=Phytophthora rubi TaxID=129364 RepID=A0A6A4F792_9STRA|nr:hypothetical protein PR003_g11756 [Phytophthora rubi]